MPDAVVSVTALHATLYAERKVRSGDELYDVSGDPGMSANLIASHNNSRSGDIWSGLFAGCMTQRTEQAKGTTQGESAARSSRN
jgi:hypothetical protein